MAGVGDDPGKLIIIPDVQDTASTSEIVAKIRKAPTFQDLEPTEMNPMKISVFLRYPSITRDVQDLFSLQPSRSLSREEIFNRLTISKLSYRGMRKETLDTVLEKMRSAGILWVRKENVGDTHAHTLPREAPTIRNFRTSGMSDTA